MRRLLALVAAAFVVATAVSPAMAGRRWQDTPDDVRTFNQGPCTDFQPEWHQVGHTNSSPSYSRSGVKATLDLSSGFSLCAPSNGTDGNVNAFVSMQPRCPACVAFDYLRLGIIECRDPYIPSEAYAGVCLGENSPQFYYAYGGGSSWTVVKVGPADYNAHILAIYFQTDDKWYFTIDGAVVFSRHAGLIPNGWAWPNSNNLMAGWSAHSREVGDSLGNSSAASWFTSARFGRYGLGWFEPGWTVGNECQLEEHTHECVFTASDAMKFYTVN